ncbi:MAG: hypothetical protein ABIK68_11400 [bacterium]
MERNAFRIHDPPRVIDDPDLIMLDHKRPLSQCHAATGRRKPRGEARFEGTTFGNLRAK